MAEHNLNQSGYVEASGAAKLGKILGPSALVIVSVNDCSHDQQPLYEDQKNELNGRVTRIFISKTRYSLVGSIRVVDLTTGQVMGSHNFESKPSNQLTSESGQPEFPPVDELKDSAMQDVKGQVHAMFFPFGDTAAVVFYDDKDCNLKQSYELFRNGDRDGALRVAESNLEQCKSAHKKDKSLARAYYDAGLLHCLRKDYDKAKELFTGAMEGKGAEVVGRTSEYCNRAREGEVALAAYRARLAQIPAPAPIVAGSGPGPKPTPEPSDAGPAAKVDPPPTRKAQPASAAERLKKLDALYKQGLISKKEYDQKRAEILNDI
jgi:tetratricopeptide (TPR) repeat protein